MNYYELRKFIEHYPKLHAEKVAASPVVNNAYPGQFNLSFTEAPWLDKFGNYLRIDQDFFFSKIQPVIRYNDYKNLILKNAYQKHLALFDMADLVGVGCFVDRAKGNNFTAFTIKEFVGFLSELNISLENVYVSCFEGASVKEATNGKYIFNKVIPPFEFGKEQWIKNGIPIKNIIPDKTRDTFLALNIYGRPTPWGYRNEIYVKTKSEELIDVGTIEHLIWEPVFLDGQIVDIKEYEHFSGLNVVGVERLTMVTNNYSSIAECEHINPLFDILEKFASKYDHNSCFIVVESIRAAHRVVSDVDSVESFSKSRRYKFNDYLEGCYLHLDNLGVSSRGVVLRELLEHNAKLNPHYPEFTSSIDKTFEVIEKYFTTRFKDKL